MKEALKAMFYFTDAQVNGSLKEVVDPRWDVSPESNAIFWH